MLQSRQSPSWRLRTGRLLVAVVVLLVASACTLNQSPDGQRVGGPPVVRLVSPAANATYLEGVPVNIQASITNAGEDIDRVEVTVDNAVVTTLPDPNENGLAAFSITHSWPAAGVGNHLVGVTAFRSDGAASEPATVTINVISPAPEVEPTTPPTEVEPSEAPANGGDEGEEPTDEGDEATDEGDEPTDEGGEPDADGPPIATFTQGANVRRGPSTSFNPPIGAFAANQTAEIVGRNPAGDWYKVRYYNADGWVFASLLTVSGDTSNIPVDAGPPTPQPTAIPPTPIPAPVATAVPASSANLVAGTIRLDPSEPACRRTFNVRVDIANLGSSDTTTTGSFTVQDFYNGQLQEQTQGSIPIIRAGQTVESAPIPITVSTNFDTDHTIVVILNSSGSVPETGATDNRSELRYRLGKGDC